MFEFGIYIFVCLFLDVDNSMLFECEKCIDIILFKCDLDKEIFFIVFFVGE